MKKIIFIISFLFLFSTSIFAINGPTSKPDIIGPKKGPPTKTEVDQLKCSKDPDFIGSDYCKGIEKKEEKNKKKETSFWEWLWNLILSIFR